MSGQKVKLQSADGDIFDVDLPVVQQFITIKTMLEGNVIERTESQDDRLYSLFLT